MSRPRKPQKLLELNGAFRKNPGRRRDEPTPNGPIGSAPEYFDTEKNKIWEELINIVPAGVLGSSDRWVLEITSVLMSEFRSNPDIKANKITQLITNLSKLGLSPADRSKVSAIPEKKTELNEWEKFGMECRKNEQREV